MRLQILELLKNSENRVDTNKGLALIGALVGAVILIIATLQKYDGIEWLLTVYLVATMGQLPSKGLHDLGRLKIEKRSNSNEFDDVIDNDVVATSQKPTPPEPPKGPGPR